MAKADHVPSRLETEAIVVGYAMSRLDDQYLISRSSQSWKHAFAEAAKALAVPPASIKNLRDEFDPVHANRRRGWHKRPLRPGRQKVLAELSEVSDDALVELIARILDRDEHATREAIDALCVPSRTVYNVAERLLTGRLAEEYFLENSHTLVGVAKESIVDMRQSAAGFDFGVRGLSDPAIEVKGLRGSRGQILFTDHEWSEALRRRENYWLIVVGLIRTAPKARLVRDPGNILKAKCYHQTSITAIWQSEVSI